MCLLTSKHVVHAKITHKCIIHNVQLMCSNKINIINHIITILHYYNKYMIKLKPVALYRLKTRRGITIVSLLPTEFKTDLKSLRS